MRRRHRKSSRLPTVALALAALSFDSPGLAQARTDGVEGLAAPAGDREEGEPSAGGAAGDSEGASAGETAAAAPADPQAAWPDLAAPLETVGGGERDAVVIVAIEDYDHVPDVPGAVKNASAWHEYFTASRQVPAERVKLITNHQATRESIERALTEASQLASEGGRVWFIFVGHGAPSQDGEDGLLLGSDVRQNADSLQARGVRHSAAVATLEQSAAQPVVLLDACFSGRAGNGDALAQGLMPTQVANLTAPKRAVVLSAAASDQYAGALPGEERPAFSYLALGALRGWGDVDADGEVTAAEIQAYANLAMRTTVQGRTQEADLSGAAGLVVASSGQESPPSLAQVQRRLSTQQAQAEAAAAASEPAPAPAPATPLTITIPAEDDLPVKGRGVLYTGYSFIALAGLSTVVMAWGLVEGNDLNQENERTFSAVDVKDLYEDGRRTNIMAYGGAAGMLVFGASGIAMTLIGKRMARDSQRRTLKVGAAPALSPTMAGVTLGGHF